MRGDVDWLCRSRMGLAEGRLLVISTNQHLASNNGIWGHGSNQQRGLRADKTRGLQLIKAPPFGWGPFLFSKVSREGATLQALDWYEEVPLKSAFYRIREFFTSSPNLAFLNVADLDARSPNHMRYATWGGGHATQWQDSKARAFNSHIEG